jgi:hypothetical protein
VLQAARQNAHATSRASDATRTSRCRKHARRANKCCNSSKEFQRFGFHINTFNNISNKY